MRILESRLVPGQGRRKSSATAARRILASSEVRISSRRELRACEISGLIERARTQLCSIALSYQSRKTGVNQYQPGKDDEVFKGRS